MKVGVIGAGAWGTALAIVSAQGGADVVLWSYDGLHKDFDGVVMPKNIRMTANMADMHDMDTWLVVTPGAFFRETMRKARNEYNGQPIIICTKGAETPQASLCLKFWQLKFQNVLILAFCRARSSPPKLHKAFQPGQHWPERTKQLSQGRAH